METGVGGSNVCTTPKGKARFLPYRFGPLSEIPTRLSHMDERFGVMVASSPTRTSTLSHMEEMFGNQSPDSSRRCKHRRALSGNRPSMIGSGMATRRRSRSDADILPMALPPKNGLVYVKEGIKEKDENCDASQPVDKEKDGQAPRVETEIAQRNDEKNIHYAKIEGCRYSIVYAQVQSDQALVTAEKAVHADKPDMMLGETTTGTEQS